MVKPVLLIDIKIHMVSYWAKFIDGKQGFVTI